MNLNDLVILTLIIALNVFLGLLVFFKNRKDRKNLYFFMLTLGVTFWNSSAFFSELTSSTDAKILLSKLSYFFAVVSLLAAIQFMYKFLELRRNPIMAFINVSLTTVFAGLTLFTPLVVDSIKLTNYGFDIVPGALSGLFMLVILFLTAQFLIYPILSYRKSRGTRKNQIKFLFLGFFFYIFFVLLFNFGFKVMFNNDQFYRYGNYSVIFLLGFTSYALIKHRLMDIRMVVARSVAYAILIATMAGFYAGMIIGIESLFYPEALAHFNWTIGAIRTLLAVIMAFSFQPLRRWITKATDAIFFKNQYDPDQLLDTLAHTIGSTIVLVELVYKTLKLLKEEMKITRGLLVVFNNNGSILNSQYSGYNGVVKVEPEDMEKLGKDGLLVYDELAENSRYKHLLRKYNASICVPIKTEETVEGVLLLGEKLSGDMYAEKDIKIFEIIAPELAVGITNAKSFEKIEKFNVTLRQEVKKATAELEHKNEQLRELDKAKDEFISMASHQLRTPLTAIKGYLSMLLEGDAGEIKVSQYDFVNEAFQGANRMVGLINDLLNVSRMETGRFFLEPVDVDLDKLVAEEVKQLTNHAKEKKLYLKYEKKGKVPVISADETKIRQVVMNFIDNAVYYTTQGGVTVTLEADKKDVIFKVTDTGIGVPKEQQKNLFTKFYRADNARHVRPDGTGLGIYLAKRVMDDHHGQLIFHSVEGKGSTFGFKFPLHSKLQVKRVAAPMPGNVGPGIGELAAGIGVNPSVLEATKLEVSGKIEAGSVAKAAGIEAPLADSADKNQMEETAKELAEKA